MDDPAAVPDPAPTTRFNLLGPLAVVVDGVERRLGGPRQVAVLGRLVLSPGLVVSMDELAEDVWDGDSPSRPDVAIRSYVSNLRRSIEPGRHRGDRRSCIESVSPGYRLMAENEQFDAYRFEQHLAVGRTALADDDPAGALVSFEAAQQLWRGEACEGLIETDTLLAFRARMSELRLATTELRCEAMLTLGRHESVIADLEAAIAAHPLRERLSELAMLALYRAGRQSDALTVCRELHNRLLDKLGVTPGPPIQELEHRILTHDPTLSPPPRSPSSAVVPSSRPELRRSIVASNRRSDSTEPAVPRGTDLVGRESELRALDVVAQQLHGGFGATVLVTGEHGIGKTKLIEHYCSNMTGATIAWGRCRSVAAENPLWPWVQILDGLAQAVVAAGPAGNEVAAAHAEALRIASNLSSGDRAGGDDGRSTPSVKSDPTTAFRPIVEVLRLLASGEPAGHLIVVIDDAQWADLASLELLSFAATALAEHPVAFIVSWRDAAPAMAATSLRSLVRSPLATRIEVGPLSRSAVDQLVESSGLGGRTLARRIWVQTNGHPHFVAELLAGLDRSQEVTAFGLSESEPRALLPSANLRDTVMERVETAHPAAEALLNVAAMHRQGFSIEVLSECVDSEPETVEEAIEALVLGGLITEDGKGAATYRFAHPIAAKAIASALSGPRRARLHATIGHAMWRQGWPSIELAHHFSRSGSTGTSLLAARFAIEASRNQMALEQIDEIEAVIVQGLEALQQLDNSEVLEVELASFLAQVARLRGSAKRFATAGRRAVDVAGFIDDDALTVEATLAATGAASGLPSFARSACLGLDLDRDPAHLESLDACLARVAPETALRSVVESRALRLKPDGSDFPSWLDDTDPDGGITASSTKGPVGGLPGALVGGIQGDDGSDDEPGVVRPQLVVINEFARHLLTYGVGTQWASVADRLQGELGNHARAIDGHEQVLVGRLRLQAALDEGDRSALDRALNRVGVPLNEPESVRPWTTVDLDRLHVRITADLVVGRLGSAEKALEIARSRCHRTGLDTTAFDRQLIGLRWEQGKFDELDELGVQLAAIDDGILATALSALSAAGRNDPAAATRHLGQLAATRAWDDALNQRRAPSLLCVGAFVAHRVGDRAIAKSCLKALLPLRGRTVAACGGGVVLGPAAYFAGLAATATGKRKQARDLLERSAEQARSLEATTWLCRILTAQADLASSDAASASTVESLRAEAAAIAAKIGAGWLDGHAERD